MSTLYITATPIGNLEDITLRALRIFKEVDTVFAEDTREGKKLLSHFDITTLVERYDEHSHEKQSEKIIELLKEGKDIAVITDAGTPGISDPGARLVTAVRETLPEASIVAVPGASALTAAISISGFSVSEFQFLGFAPHKKGRETFFRNLSTTSMTTIFYESPHRILKTLESLVRELGAERRVAIARELTKFHEEFLAGTAQELLNYFLSNPDRLRGEFVVIVEGR